MAIYATTIINKAKSYEGTKENPSNSNNVVFNTHYYGRAVSGSAYPWCCVFIWDIFRLCNASKLFYEGKKTAYCPTLENWFKDKKQYFSNGQAGDICFMDFGKGRASHVGIVLQKNADGSYKTIEGNTSTTSNDNGGKVMIRTRKTNVIRGFGRPAYDKPKTDNDVLNLQKAINADLKPKPLLELDNKCGPLTKAQMKKVNIKKPTIGANKKYPNITKFVQGKVGVDKDGKYGKNTVAAVKAYQKKHSLKVDGIVGYNTLMKMIS